LKLGKVASIEKIKSTLSTNLVCEVKGRTDLAEKISKILPCNFVKASGDKSFDVELTIGEAFINEY